MKVAPARVPDYSNTDEMLARYRSIHSAFWRQFIPPPETIRPPELPPAPPPAAKPAAPPPPLVRSEPREPSIGEILWAVCDEFNLRKNELVAERRSLDVVRPRHIAFALCKHLTSRSLPEIGRRFGGRDHTTVLHGIRKMAASLEATKDGMPDDATPAEWVRVMREYVGI
jgi:hypothetical protein